ncbi:MAG: riboflavin synthase [Desulfomicrobium sp.]|nr:riboflavin synthase [Desulfomicrobium sp.]
MFTGLIECVGNLRSLQRQHDAVRLQISAPFATDEIAIGDSIAVNGVCLTVTALADNLLSFDISPETVDCTSFKIVSSGSRLNLERALKLGARLDGHLVSGHIDCTGRLESIENRGNAKILTFSLPQQHGQMLVEKGSVAIDGISLTVNNLQKDRFSVAIIPHTLANTTLVVAKPGQVVNIETDIIGKYVARLLAPAKEQKTGLTMETLLENGFM